MDKQSTRNQSLEPIGNILKKFDATRDKYISREFQAYGYHLAEQLGDMRHKALYIKLAKETPRASLEAALSFVKDANKVKNKGSLFMWKLEQIKKAQKERTNNDGE